MIQNGLLSGRVISADGHTYNIHGIIHENPLVSVTSEYKKAICEALRGLHVICEDGISEGIENAESFRESEYFGFNDTKISDYFNGLKSYFYNRFILKTHKTRLSRRVKELKTLEDLNEIRNDLLNQYPTEPEGMNMLMVRCGSGTIESPKGELPLRVRRYVYEAKESLRYAKAKGFSELHIVVGCAHELPLEYLLKNQEILSRLSV